MKDVFINAVWAFSIGCVAVVSLICVFVLVEWILRMSLKQNIVPNDSNIDKVEKDGSSKYKKNK